MLLLDDILIKPFFSILDILHKMALDSMYDMEELRDELKENQLMYEIGERSRDEYEKRKQELKSQIQMAEEIQSQMGSRMEIKS